MKVEIPEEERMLLFLPASSATLEFTVFSVASCVSVEEEFIDKEEIPPNW